MSSTKSNKYSRKGGYKKGHGLSSIDTKREEELHRIPGRIILSGSIGLASLFTRQGRKGTNQDAMIVWENFGSGEGAIFCGVFDGHGPLGDLVAAKVRDSLPLRLSAHWDAKAQIDDLEDNAANAAGSMNSGESDRVCSTDERCTSMDSERKESHPEFFWSLRKSYLKTCKAMDKELGTHPKIDCFYSGTTAVTLVKQGQELVVSNVGDSRAILATRDDNNHLVAFQLTVDCKVNLPGEAERIRQCRGRVFAIEDEPEVARLWLPDGDSPGLAMSRSFGDFCLKDFGLISEPDVSHRLLTEKDEFIVLATDGIWDVLSNEEVVEVVASTQDPSNAARTLVESAMRAWKRKHPTSKFDDCTAICLFLNTDQCSSSVSSNSTSNTSFGGRGREEQKKREKGRKDHRRRKDKESLLLEQF